jgi:integrase
MRLTDLTLKTLAAPDKGAKVYADDTLEGFGVRVSQGGTRAYVLTYGADRRRVTIGRVGIITLAQARAEAKRILAERTLGKLQPARLKAADALERFLEAKAEKNRARSVQETTWLLKKHFKSLWAMNLADITSDDVTRVVSKLAKTHPSAANHATTAIKTFFRWCVTQRKYLTHSPIEGLQLPATTSSRERVLTIPELQAIWQACGDDTYSKIVKVLMLTGLRRSEATHARLEGDLVVVPAAYSKNKQEHVVPVPLEAQNCLSEPLSWSGWSKGKVALDKRIQGQFEWHLHDLRRTHATTLASLGVLPHIIEALHNRKTIIAGTSAIYNRYTYLNEMRHAVSLFENWFETVIKTDRPD